MFYLDKIKRTALRKVGKVGLVPVVKEEVRKKIKEAFEEVEPKDKELEIIMEIVLEECEIVRDEIRFRNKESLQDKLRDFLR